MNINRPIFIDLNNGKQELFQSYEIEGQLIHAGYVTNWASVPVIYTILIPKMGKYNRAVLFHDFIYQYQYMSRKQADDKFLKIALADRAPKHKVYAMYLGMRCFGWLYWNDPTRVVIKWKRGL